MRFSIIVPVYNSAEYLQSCVESILGQSFPHWELILVDDGSTDGSGAMADAFAAADPRIRVIHQENSGQFAARTAGMAESRGEYILCVDSDDLLTGDALELLDGSAKATGAQLLLFPYQLIGDHPRAGAVEGCYAPRDTMVDRQALRKSLLSSHTFNALWSKAFSRRLLPMDTLPAQFYGQCYGEDKAMVLHLVTRAESIAYLSKPLYQYRRHSQSLMGQVTPERASAMLLHEMFRVLRGYMQLWDMDSEDDRRAVAAYYLRNYSNVLYCLRKACREGRQRRPSPRALGISLPREAAAYALRCGLSLRELLKLFLAIH